MTTSRSAHLVCSMSAKYSLRAERMHRCAWKLSPFTRNVISLCGPRSCALREEYVTRFESENLRKFKKCVKRSMLKLAMMTFVLLMEINHIAHHFHNIGLFTLHWNWTGTGTGNWTSTIGNNGPRFLPLSVTIVNNSAQYIRIHCFWPCSLNLSWSRGRSRAV